MIFSRKLKRNWKVNMMRDTVSSPDVWEARPKGSPVMDASNQYNTMDFYTTNGNPKIVSCNTLNSMTEFFCVNNSRNRLYEIIFHFKEPIITYTICYTSVSDRDNDYRRLKTYTKDVKQPNKKGGSKMLNSVKQYFENHRDILMSIAVALLVDHFFFEGAFRDKIKNLVDGLINRAEKKLEEK